MTSIFNPNNLEKHSTELSYPITVVIPVYNEESCIVNVLEELDNVLSKQFDVYEIITVDDKSTDNTTKLLQSQEKINNRLKVIYQNENRGQSHCLMQGIKNASYERIVMMDGDGQYNPTDIILLYQLLSKDIVLISGKRNNRKDNFLYRKASKIGNRVISYLLGTQIEDLGCGLKIGYKNHLERLPYFKHIHRYFQIIYFNSGLKYKEVTINHRPRIGGVSKYSLLKIFNIIPRLLWLKITRTKLTEE